MGSGGLIKLIFQMNLRAWAYLKDPVGQNQMHSDSSKVLKTALFSDFSGSSCVIFSDVSMFL